MNRAGLEGTRTIDPAEAWQAVGQRLRGYVARRVAPAEVDDIVQSVMVKLLEHRNEIGADSVRAWLFTVTRNAIAEYYRQKRPAADLAELGDLPQNDSSDATDRALEALTDCLEPMLGALAETDADVLRRIDLEGESQTDLAVRLGLPLSTLKSRVQRARAKLRAAFDACCSIEAGMDGTPIGMEPGGACKPGPCASD